MDQLYIYIILFAVIFIFLYFVNKYINKKEVIPFSERYSIVSPNNTIKFNRKSTNLNDQSQDWINHMKICGMNFLSLNTSSVFFIHGTFVGSDPLGILQIFNTNLRSKTSFFKTSLERFSKKCSDLVLNDLGNFTPQYVKLFENAIGNNIKCHSFTWSSENHHFARVRGALELLKELSLKIKKQKHNKNSSIFLFSHSHGGQVLAIFSHIINNTKIGKMILSFLIENNINIDDLKNDIIFLQCYQFYYITLGTPILYTWPEGIDKNLVHITNGRKKNRFRVKNNEIRNKDFIQRCGTHGSDFPASTKYIRDLNEKLDKILGNGYGVHKLIQYLFKNHQYHKLGFTYYINFQNESYKLIPQFISSGFGHALYTKYQYMHLLAELSSYHFCKEKKQ